MTDIIEEDVTMTLIITTTAIIPITAEAASIVMMMTTITQVRLQAVLHRAVQATAIKHLPEGIVQEVRQAQVHLPAIRLLQAEEAVAVLRQEVQDHITGQAGENPDIKKTFP